MCTVEGCSDVRRSERTTEHCDGRTLVTDATSYIVENCLPCGIVLRAVQRSKGSAVATRQVNWRIEQTLATSGAPKCTTDFLLNSPNHTTPAQASAVTDNRLLNDTVLHRPATFVVTKRREKPKYDAVCALFRPPKNQHLYMRETRGGGQISLTVQHPGG